MVNMKSTEISLLTNEIGTILIFLQLLIFILFFFFKKKKSGTFIKRPTEKKKSFLYRIHYYNIDYDWTSNILTRFVCSLYRTFKIIHIFVFTRFLFRGATDRFFFVKKLAYTNSAFSSICFFIALQQKYFTSRVIIV
ncbi:hypothetical protein C1646_414713 [Rhizophagus diaphanus]|nr:hypothetical protein C1646_414713 [Rhizophagus diaphanus] [Rhizophagus sp. MUCL 43196]